MPIAPVPGAKGKISDKSSLGGVQSVGLKIPDNEAIVMFISFYKLLFLGSKFAKKMLKLKLESSSVSSDKLIFEQVGATTDDDAKDSSYLIDTSDFIQSDLNDLNDDSLLHEGNLDAYQKIKIHANLALRNLLKNNSKILFNYWQLMFPSFMIKPRSEFHEYLFSFKDSPQQEQFQR